MILYSIQKGVPIYLYNLRSYLIFMEKKARRLLVPVVILILIIMAIPMWPVQITSETYGADWYYGPGYYRDAPLFKLDEIYQPESRFELHSLYTIISHEFLWVESELTYTEMDYDYILHVERNIFAFGFVLPALFMILFSFFVAKRVVWSKKTRYTPIYNFQR